MKPIFNLSVAVVIVGVFLMNLSVFVGIALAIIFFLLFYEGIFNLLLLVFAYPAMWFQRKLNKRSEEFWREKEQQS